MSDAATIRLTFADGTQSPARITATQPENDIAVLQAVAPPAQNFPATAGNPNAMRIGDEAFVVGHPLGLYGSMSSGMISGFDRSFKPTNSNQALDGLIQIDAAVNPGNSGGPLLNRDGQVIGIVAGLVNPTDQEALGAAITSLTTGRGTAMDSGILRALGVIAEIDPNVAPSIADGAAGIAPPPVPRGAYVPEIVVLLTDGVTTTGPYPLDAAQQAVDRGIRVYTIGFGTDNGGLSFGGRQFGADPQGQGGFRRGIDAATLTRLAEMTGGTCYAAAGADELQTVFQNLPTSLIMKREAMESSVLFTALGAVLVALALGLSLRWNPLG